MAQFLRLERKGIRVKYQWIDEDLAVIDDLIRVLKAMELISRAICQTYQTSKE